MRVADQAILPEDEARKRRLLDGMKRTHESLERGGAVPGFARTGAALPVPSMLGSAVGAFEFVLDRRVKWEFKLHTVQCLNVDTEIIGYRGWRWGLVWYPNTGDSYWVAPHAMGAADRGTFVPQAVAGGGGAVSVPHVMLTREQWGDVIDNRWFAFPFALGGQMLSVLEIFYRR